MGLDMFSILFGSSGEGQTPPPNCSVCGLYHQGKCLKDREVEIKENEKLSEFDQLELLKKRLDSRPRPLPDFQTGCSACGMPRSSHDETTPFVERRETVPTPKLPARKIGWLQKIFAEASKRVEDWPAWKKKIETSAVRRFSVLHGREYGRSAPCDIFDVWFDNRFPDGFGVDKTYLREAFEAGQMSARYYYFGDTQ